MGFILTRATCPCGAVSDSAEDTYIWRFQHNTPEGKFCSYYFGGQK